jgi:hypothetical protein
MISTRVIVASRSLPLELPLLSVHLLALIVDYNSMIHKFLKAGVDIGHQLQVETIIQPFRKRHCLSESFATSSGA